MPLLISSEEIAQCLRGNPPNRIAVAYLGIGWENFIDSKAIDNIIISPTSGTNPRAVSELVEEIGWDRVHFLTTLHSKLYLSNDIVIMGSANLSNNGLGANAQFELAASFTDQQTITEANTLFEAYLTQSNADFQTNEMKIAKLNELWKIYNQQVVYGFENRINNNRDFSNYNPETHGTFYIIWYINGETGYTEEVPIQVIDTITSEVHFSPNDTVENHRWVLSWKKTNDNTVSMQGGGYNISWIYLHEIYPNGCNNDEGYEKLGIQREDQTLPNQPFELTDEFKIAFAAVIQNEDFDQYRNIPEDGIWLVNNTRDCFIHFINTIQDVLQ